MDVVDQDGDLQAAGPGVVADGRDLLPVAVDEEDALAGRTGAWAVARSGAITELVTAVGPLLGAQVGESLRLRGQWTSHVKFGLAVRRALLHDGAAGN